jgi:hypothetical protein
MQFLFLAFHQGRTVTSRSNESVIREADELPGIRCFMVM